MEGTVNISREVKDKIDSMSYEEMLREWRFSEIPNPLFEGDAGKYFAYHMERKKCELSESEKVAISKQIGWNQ